MKKSFFALCVSVCALSSFCLFGLSECASEEKTSPIQHFEFHHGGMSGDDCYSITIRRVGNTAKLQFQMALTEKPLEKDLDVSELDDLLKMINEYRVSAWDGFDKVNSMVLDGTSFTLSVSFEDGSCIHAYGSNAFPKGYYNVEEFIWQRYAPYREELLEIVKKE